MNVAEVIPYKNHKEKFRIVFQELLKNRYVEVWDKYIYSAKKVGGENMGKECRTCVFNKKQNAKRNNRAWAEKEYRKREEAIKEYK